jgi:hypothetical protein
MKKVISEVKLKSVLNFFFLNDSPGDKTLTA